MVSENTITEVLNRYIGYEEHKLSLIDEMDNGKNAIGTTEWKMRDNVNGRIELLNDLKEELL